MTEFDSSMSEQDFRSLVYFTSFSKHAWVPGMLVIGMAFSLTVIFTYLLHVWVPSKLLVFSAFSSALIVIFLFVSTEIKVARAISERSVPIDIPYHITANSCSMTCTILESGRQKNYPWETIGQIYETHEHFIIYLSSRNAFIFNKKCIDPKRVQEFHQILKSQNASKYHDLRGKKFLLCKEKD